MFARPHFMPSERKIYSLGHDGMFGVECSIYDCSRSGVVLSHKLSIVPAWDEVHPEKITLNIKEYGCTSDKETIVQKEKPDYNPGGKYNSDIWHLNDETRWIDGENCLNAWKSLEFES
ncbi:MAG: hypothetical protein LBJ12_00665 [Oscillospiraceae bacterium]|jgi:hypothetical protein|nr:hypothetical protein [Oscillospiraceae bacterium]